MEQQDRDKYDGKELELSEEAEGKITEQINAETQKTIQSMQEVINKMQSDNQALLLPNSQQLADNTEEINNTSRRVTEQVYTEIEKQGKASMGGVVKYLSDQWKTWREQDEDENPSPEQDKTTGNSL